MLGNYTITYGTGNVQTTGDGPRKAEFWCTSIFDLDPNKPPSAIRADAWKWFSCLW